MAAEAAYLTAALQRCGVLTDGRVISVEAEAPRKQMQRHAGAFERFADHLGDRLSRERRQLYERFFAAAPSLQARVLTYRNVTLVHGDAHVWNCFVPKDGSDDLRYFDWDT